MERIPPGKFVQVFHCTIPFLFRDPLPIAGDPENVNPLVSQPIIEMCLKIPTYFHANGDRDRALARRAFSQNLPHDVLCRTWKGGVEGHAKAMLMHNLGFFRELLLDGLLVKRGILDRSRLEIALSGRPTKSDAFNTEVFDYVGIEAWLQAWGGAENKSQRVFSDNLRAG
jgi:asparagine synthase (glutamine-hydrolysing)